VAGRVDRPGLARLLADAAGGRFDAVVVDDLDRLDTDPRRLEVVLGRLAADDVAVWPRLPARSATVSGRLAGSRGHRTAQRLTRRVSFKYAGLLHGYSTTEVAV